MRIENLLGRVRFERIEPGTYAPVPLSFLKPAYESAGLELMSLEPDEDSFGAEFLFEESIGALEEPPEPIKPVKPQTIQAKPEKSPEQIVRAFAPIRSATFKSAIPRRKALIGAKAEKTETKPNDIQTLERILSREYNTKIKITSVKELPVTRKQVKQVFFLMNDGISQVWIFKADPEKTAQELSAYQIIYEQGVPTGRPIGYELGQKSYPFDIAILGGIVEHAGNPYNQLIENMNLEPQLIFRTAGSIAKMIANYHVKLTAAVDEFEQRGIHLEKSSPRTEIINRFLVGLKVDIKFGEGLIKACEDLYNQQSGQLVVSHGDDHTGNIVTIEEMDEKTGLTQTSIDKFGVIDWGSLVLDYPYGDLQDFWLHHQRQALKVCNRYDFIFEKLDTIYREQFKKTGRDYGLSLDNRHRKKNALIQSALWNIYEMYDPTRKDTGDIRQKAVTHCKALFSALNKLKDYSCREQVNAIKGELRILLRNKDYLKDMLT